MEYKIYKIDSEIQGEENKGSKEKFWTDLNGKHALIKFNKCQQDQDVRSFNVSEKIFSEIALFLNFNCVTTDFIVTEHLKFGIASYDYKALDSNMLIISGDDLFLSVFGRVAKKRSSKKEDKITKEDYTYNHIIKILMDYDETGMLLDQFNMIMLMDALTGESDRHFENWGIYCVAGNCYKLLPMYDNSSCLLHQFRDESIMEETLRKYDLRDYAQNSKCKISIEGKIYNHFSFVEYLLCNLPTALQKSLQENICKLNLLTDSKIMEIVNSVPDCLASKMHKKCIIDYIILRRDILLGLVKK